MGGGELRRDVGGIHGVLRRPVDRSHPVAGDLVEEPAVPERLADGASRRGHEHAREADVVDGQLHRGRVAQADPVGAARDEVRQRARPPAGAHLPHEERAPLRDRDGLLAGEQVPPRRRGEPGRLGRRPVEAGEELRRPVGRQRRDVVAGLHQVHSEREPGPAAVRRQQLLAGVGRVVALEGRRRVDARLAVEGGRHGAPLHRARGGRIPVDELPQPQLHVEQPPERQRLGRGPAAQEGVERPHHRLLVEVRPGPERLRGEDPVDVVLHAHEPGLVGRREPDLVAPPNDRRRQQPRGGVAQRALVAPGVHDGGVVEPPQQPQQLGVQEGHASLDREAHRVAVLVAQQRGKAVPEQVVLEARLEVVGHDLEPVAGVGGQEVGGQQRVDWNRPAMQKPIEQTGARQSPQRLRRAQRLGEQAGPAPAPPQLPQVHQVVGEVPRQHLVGALAVDHHRHVPARLPHHAVLGVGTGRDDRFLLGPDEVLEVGEEGVGAGTHLVHPERASAAPRDSVHVALLVVALAREDGGEGLLALAHRGRLGVRLGQQPVDRGHDRGGVQAAGQRRPHRHVAHQPAADGRPQRPGHARPSRVVVGLPVGGQPAQVVVERGVRAPLHRAVRRDDRQLAGQQSRDPGEEGALAIVVDAEPQVPVDGLVVRPPVDQPAGQDRPDLAGWASHEERIAAVRVSKGHGGSDLCA